MKNTDVRTFKKVNQELIYEVGMIVMFQTHFEVFVCCTNSFFISRF